MRTKLIFIISFLFFLSCGNKKKGKENIDVFEFQFQQEIQIEADSIFTNEIFEINGWVHVDSFLFIQSTNTDTIFYMYSTPNLTFKKSFGLRGQGPDDYLYPHITTDHLNRVYIYDNGNKKFQTIQISENAPVIENQSILKEAEIFNFLGYIENSLFCIKKENPNSISLNLYQIVSNETKLLSSLKIIEEANGESHEKDFVVTNNKRCLFVAYLHQKVVEFYQINEENKFHKKFVYSDEKDLDVNEYHYTDICSSDHSIYALYQGMKKQEISQSASKSTVEVFDKNGKIEMKFRLDRLIKRIMIDNNGRILYAISPYESDYIYKYDLSKMRKNSL